MVRRDIPCIVQMEAPRTRRLASSGMLRLHENENLTLPWKYQEGGCWCFMQEELSRF